MEGLYSKVTAAIKLAEQAEESGGRADAHTKQAWAMVSDLEEQVASQAPSAAERNIGRRGAVRAALKSGNRERARLLVALFENQPDLDKNSNTAIRDLVANPEQVWND